MEDVVRIDFKEEDRQWLVTLFNANGDTRPGEPFPASGHEDYTKLQQVLARLTSLGYRPHRIPYNQVNRGWYIFEVSPLDE